MRTRLRHLPKLLLVLAVLGFGAWLASSGKLRGLDAARVRHHLEALGPFAPLAYLALWALIQPLGPSGHLFVVAATLVWAGPQAFALAWLGAVLGQVSAFAFYRYLAREWAQRRIPTRLRSYEIALVQRPFRTVLALRLLSYTWPVMPAVLGVSRVRFTPMLLATIVGLAPMTAVDVWLGASLFAWLFGR